jgi:hypothetical protein
MHTLRLCFHPPVALFLLCSKWARRSDSPLCSASMANDTHPHAHHHHIAREYIYTLPSLLLSLLTSSTPVRPAARCAANGRGAQTGLCAGASMANDTHPHAHHHHIAREYIHTLPLYFTHYPPVVLLFRPAARCAANGRGAQTGLCAGASIANDTHPHAHHHHIARKYIHTLPSVLLSLPTSSPPVRPAARCPANGRGAQTGLCGGAPPLPDLSHDKTVRVEATVLHCTGMLGQKCVCVCACTLGRQCFC